MINPGTTSSASAGLEIGQAFTSAPLTFFSLADIAGIDLAKVPAEFAPVEALSGAAAIRGATRLDRLAWFTACFRPILCSRGPGASTTTAGRLERLLSSADALETTANASQTNDNVANSTEDRCIASYRGGPARG